ncbi:FAD-dependent oxidoreductase [Paenibacillus roseipurpureus]|uniref:FAD-dependent oxidoreductase n=1 Tax=Paenibacillus roseopurpureus TaxID=2918901 RepID=A0AA96LQZ2_9BACL|nr:FAD-dependent oxidoreductase [Paenibacillus sp. MBLB1832]WNR45627.1 FAD-dependent oxidoreductase [Paenibacillus sp. MBLB1832]
MKTIHEKYDVVVCGGGLAGVCAAVASARSGAATCLIQDRPVFGGNSSSEIRVPPQGAANFHAYARETGILSELLQEERAKNHENNHDNGLANSIWDLILYNKVVSTEGLTFHLNTSVTDVEVRDGNLTGIRASVANAETELKITGTVFIDCTGDGVIAAMAGCSWRMGTEGRSEFGEDHAPNEPSTDVMGSSIHFRARDIGRPIPFQAPEWAYSYDDPSVFYQGGRIPNSPENGYWWIELGVPWHTIYDNEKLRHELTRHVLGIWDYIKNKDPQLQAQASHFAIDWIGQVPGKRESRRIEGLYMMTEKDTQADALCEDEIAYGGWFIDLHSAGGLLAAFSELGAKDGHESASMHRSYVGPYRIPLRSLVARDISNLMLAGRNISVTHVVLGSLRVQGTTALLGQAAGTAAAYSVTATLGNMHAFVMNKEAVAAVQQRLLLDDCFLLGLGHTDLCDLAKEATVIASSQEFFEGSSHEPLPQESNRLVAKHAQWIGTGSGRIDTVRCLISNLSEQPQKLEATLWQVDHIWDYRVDPGAQLASYCTVVPPGPSPLWVDMPIRGELSENLQSRYLRLDLGANSQLAWHSTNEVAYGMPAAYDMGNGSMRRLGDGKSMAIIVDPAQDCYAPSNVLSGTTRPYRHTNIWRAASEEPLPAWLELEWTDQRLVRTIQLTFGGQLLRDYRFDPALSRSPDCPKRYLISMWSDGGWRELVTVTDNIARQRRHVLDASVFMSKLRVTFLEMNGESPPSLYEVRVYCKPV